MQPMKHAIVPGKRNFVNKAVPPKESGGHATALYELLRGHRPLVCLLQGLSEPVGALIALLFVKPFLTPLLLQYMLAFVGGIMVGTNLPVHSSIPQMKGGTASPFCLEICSPGLNLGVKHPPFTNFL